MKKLSTYILMIPAFVLCMACEEESDLAINRVAAPVVIEVEDSNPSEITATVTELDKTGILDNSVGVVATPVSGLPVDVLVSGVSIGSFTTDTSGKIIVTYVGDKPNEFAGSYKGIAFRIKK
jgi:hypothetical protein